MADMHTPEQIAQWALESNMPTAGDLRAPTISQLTRFAALVAQHERERTDRLQRILDSRPAVNAGLPDTYVAWTQGIYEMELARKLGMFDDAAIRNSDGG